MSYFFIFFSSHHLSYVHKFLDTFLCQCSANVTGGKSVLMIMFTKVDQGINIKRNVHQGHQVQSELLDICWSPQYPSELLRTHILKFFLSPKFQTCSPPNPQARRMWRTWGSRTWCSLSPSRRRAGSTWSTPELGEHADVDGVESVEEQVDGDDDAEGRQGQPGQHQS